MEEGIATAWAQFGALKEVHQCIECVCYLGVTLLLAWGRLGSISAPFGEPASPLVQLNVREYGRR
jgi:hypothetical protein